MIITKLKDILEERGLTQKDLIDITGINKNTINRLYWCNFSRINKNDLDSICKNLNCEIGDILEYIKEDEK